jgi:hypothetical protein
MPGPEPRHPSRAKDEIMSTNTNRHVGRARLFAVAALVVAAAACADDAPADDGPSDTRRYQEQDQEPSGSGAVTDDERDAGTELPLLEDDSETDGGDTGAAATSADGPVGLPVSDVLDPDEVAGLYWMREEEQLAHDVYVALGNEWGMRIFENISASERQHIDLTLGLLERYDLPDPAAGNQPGTFTDPRLQELFDDLIVRGMASTAAALTVGATIEELDIADLRARAEATDEAAIDDVYTRLERASRNHLRAFVGRLELLGVDYEPTVLADFEAIVSSPMERGQRDR